MPAVEVAGDFCSPLREGFKTVTFRSQHGEEKPAASGRDGPIGNVFGEAKAFQ